MTSWCKGGSDDNWSWNVTEGDDGVKLSVNGCNFTPFLKPFFNHGWDALMQITFWWLSKECFSIYDVSAICKNTLIVLIEQKLPKSSQRFKLPGPCDSGSVFHRASTTMADDTVSLLTLDIISNYCNRWSLFISSVFWIPGVIFCVSIFRKSTLSVPVTRWRTRVGMINSW